MNPPFILELARHIRAPRAKVFDSFITREAMSAWMCPRGLTLPEVAVDARVGGRYRLVMRARDGSQFTVSGEFRELKRPERLAYTWQWQGETMPNVETLVTVTLSERAGGTDLVMQHAGFPDAGMRDSHTRGWQSTLNRLADTTDERGQAASIVLMGDGRSTYVRTVRLALAEKGIRYTHQPTAPHTPEQIAVHPFGRIPALVDGDFKFFEASAIVRYLEESFPGPSLLPGTIYERTLCEQWVSAINSYYYEPMIRRYVLPYVFPKGADGKPDRATIDGALREMPKLLSILDVAYGARDYLVGSAPSIADLFLAPILAYVMKMPEGEALLGAAPNVGRAQHVMQARPSFAATQP